MAIRLLPRRTSTASKVPSISDLVDGELGVNTADRKIYIRVGAAVVELFKTLTKADVGLSSVDNTSDVNKPISTATQTALNAKAPLNGVGTSGTWPINITGSAATAATAGDASSLGGVSASSYATNSYVQNSTKPVAFGIACSDETSVLTAGASKATFRLPMGVSNLGVRASLTEAQSSGSVFTVDINVNGVSILNTKLTIDNNEKTSVTAASPAVLNTNSLPDDAEVTVDIDQVGVGAKGLKIWIVGRAP